MEKLNYNFFLWLFFELGDMGRQNTSLIRAKLSALFIPSSLNANLLNCAIHASCSAAAAASSRYLYFNWKELVRK